ncbi:unnamed protein product, partial [Cladocopium goreaui]
HLLAACDEAMGHQVRLPEEHLWNHFCRFAQAIANTQPQVHGTEGFQQYMQEVRGNLLAKVVMAKGPQCTEVRFDFNKNEENSQRSGRKNLPNSFPTGDIKQPADKTQVLVKEHKQPGNRAQEPDTKNAEETPRLHPPMCVHAMPSGAFVTDGPTPRPMNINHSGGQPAVPGDGMMQPKSNDAAILPPCSLATAVKPDRNTGGIVAFASQDLFVATDVTTPAKDAGELSEVTYKEAESAYAVAPTIATPGPEQMEHALCKLKRKMQHDAMSTADTQEATKAPKLGPKPIEHDRQAAEVSHVVDPGPKTADITASVMHPTTTGPTQATKALQHAGASEVACSLEPMQLQPTNTGHMPHDVQSAASHGTGGAETEHATHAHGHDQVGDGFTQEMLHAVEAYEAHSHHDKADHTHVIQVIRQDDVIPTYLSIPKETTVGSITVAEAKLGSLTPPICVNTSVGTRILSAANTSPYQQVFLKEMARYGSGRTSDEITMPIELLERDAITRLALLYRQEAFVADDEMRYYLSMLTATGQAIHAPIAIIPEEYRDEELELLLKDWFAKVFTTPGGADWVHIAIRDMDKACSLHTTEIASSFLNDCGFQSVAWIMSFVFEVIKNRTEQKQKFGSKQMKKKPSFQPKAPIQIQADDIGIPDGIFQDASGHAIHQKALVNIGPEASGIIVAQAQQAVPYLKFTQPVSTQGLALLVLDHMNPLMHGVGEEIRFPARFEKTSEPILISAKLVQLGASLVSRTVPDQALRVDEVHTQVVRVVMFRDEIDKKWDAILDKPVKYLVSIVKMLQPNPDGTSAIMDVWDMQWLNEKMERTKPADASLFMASFRMERSDIVDALKESGGRFGLRVKVPRKSQRQAMQVPSIQASAKTMAVLKASDAAEAADQDPWETNDPWGNYQTPVKAPKKAIASEVNGHDDIDLIAAKVQRKLQPNWPQQPGTKMEVDPDATENLRIQTVEDRLAKLEHTVQSNHVQQGKHAQELASQIAQVQHNVDQQGKAFQALSHVQNSNPMHPADRPEEKQPPAQAHFAPTSVASVQKCARTKSQAWWSRRPYPRFGIANPTGALNKSHLFQEASDLSAPTTWAISETHLTKEGIQRFRHELKFKSSQWKYIPGAPAQPLTKAPGCIGGKYTGVGILTNSAARALPNDWSQETWESARLQACTVRTQQQWVKLGVAYGYAKQPHTRATREATDQILENLTERIVFQSKGYRILCGDLNQDDPDALEQFAIWREHGFMEEFGNTPPVPIWRKPGQIPWEEIDVDTFHQEFQAIYIDFKTEFEALEKMLIRARCQRARDLRMSDSNAIFRDVAKPRSLPVSTVVVNANANITEALEPGDHLAQPKLAGDLQDVFKAFEDLWTPMWQKHKDTSVAKWAPIMQEIQEKLPQPPEEMLMPPLTPEQWLRAVKRKKSTSAVGPDGVSKQDLLNMPPPLVTKLVDQINDIEHGRKEWPQAAMVGFAEGDPLSVVSMVLVNCAMHTLVMQKVSPISVISYVDNWEAQSTQPEATCQALQAMIDFAEAIDI